MGRFRDALAGEGLAAIAEVKRRSPSAGDLRPGADPAVLVRQFAAAGASAVSVLVDERFGGSLDDLRAARQAASLPVLCKEFIVDPYQVYEAFLYGADAVLLIAAILSSRQLRAYRELCAGLGLAALVEVHNEVEIRSALDSGADVIGINNRDLHTFAVSLDTTRSLLPLVPPGVITVSESGIHNASDREAICKLEVDALLVGEALIAAPDIAAATREICGYSPAMKEASLR